MKKGQCQQCDKRTKCKSASNCPYLTKDLNRITKGRKKRIRTVCESDLVGPQATRWANAVYGAYTDKDGE